MHAPSIGWCCGVLFTILHIMQKINIVVVLGVYPAPHQRFGGCESVLHRKVYKTVYEHKYVLNK